MRIAKFIANCGVCSRRQAEKMIEEGKVRVGAEVISSPALNIDPDNADIYVNDKKIHHHNQSKLWLYYKPSGLVTTHSDPQNRPTVFNSLPKSMKRVVSVGRLDLNSEGLLLFTNSGDLVREFENPRNKIERHYKVRVFGPKTALLIRETELNIDDCIYKPKLIHQISCSESKGSMVNAWYEVILEEGKNREIRKIFTHYGYEVSRLIRTRFGKYSLGDLKPGQIREVKL